MTGQDAGSMARANGDAGWLRGGAQRMLVVGLGVSLGLAALGDLAVRELAWPLALSFAVGALALALAVLAGPGSPVRVLATIAVTGSLVGTALFVARADHDFSLFEVGALLVLLVDRWRVARRPSDWVLVAGLIVALLVMPLRSAVSEPDIAGEYAGTGLAMLLVVSLAVAVATTLRNQDALRVAAVTAVRRAERAEIARELHDVVAHHVTGIVVATQAARTVAADGTTRPVDAAVAAIGDSGSQALGAMRRLVGVLRSGGEPGVGPLSPAPVLSDLDELVRRFRDTGAAGEVDLDLLLDDRDRLAPELQAAVYRVVREALTNASRHAFGAARVRIAVTAAGGLLEVEVTNSAGRAATPADTVAHGGLGGLGGGFGVIGMRERAQALGGYLAAGPRPDGGWTVHATVPLPPPSGDEDGEPAVSGGGLHDHGGTRQGGRSVAQMHADAAAGGTAGQPRGGTQRVLVAGVGITLAVLAVGDLTWPGSFWWWPLTYLAVSGLALAAVIRRGRATRILAAAAVVGSLVATALFFALGTGREYSLLEAGALLVLLADRWRVARGPGDRALVAGTIVALLALPLRPAPDAVGPYDTGSQLAIEVLVVLTAVAVAVAVATVLRSQDALRVAAVTAVRRAERAEIARELHDVVAHHVTGIVVATQAARTVAASDAPPHADAPLAAIEDTGSQALGAMRRLVGVLRTEVDPAGAGTSGSAVGPRSPTPTLRDLDELVRRFRDTGAAGRVDLDLLLDDRDRLTPDLQAAAYRMVQEALTNASQHALGAARVRIAVTTAAPDVLEIEVTNSAGHCTAGTGNVVPGRLTGISGGTGLVRMGERAQALGGHLAAGPRPDGGWTVHATIPLPPPHPDLLDAERGAR